MIFTNDTRGSLPPLWWRIPSWIAIIIVSVIQTHDLTWRILGGILMVVGAAAVQFLSAENRQLRASAILLATVTGLTACFAMPNGLAEVLVVVAAARAPRGFSGFGLRWFTVLDTLAFGATVGLTLHSLPGVLAGLGIPLLIQREVEHQTLIRERDRAQALLAEVQAGREAETQAAALRERGRIAREMHDVLAHSLAGLSVQLQAVRAVAAREKVPAVVLDPLDKAALLAREGLSEARSAVSTLRDPVGLGVDSLPDLIERHPGRATLVANGSGGAMSAEAGHAIYRAVQESMTNAARYAPGSPVAVVLDWTPTCLIVTVTDDGPAPGRTAVAEQGTGLGLAGMSERVTQAGGTVRSGARAERGWETVIEVPASSEEQTL